jgi:UDP-N-acetylmuramate dehydrogenase
MSTTPIAENVSLAPYTTLQIGGPARFFLKAKTEEQVFEGLHFSQKNGCPVFILGGGSNLVISDSGFPGLVLKLELLGIKGSGEDDKGKVSAAAGEEWDDFVCQCVDQDLAGIECLSGIPGTVGGTPVQNVGAYGQEVGEIISRVRVLDRISGSISDLSNADCMFAYRTSIFNASAKDRYIVLRVEFVLHPDREPQLRYRELQQHFSGNRDTPSIRDVRATVLQIRESKGMVRHEADPESKNAGSFFKNPILTPGQADAIEERARAYGVLPESERIPRFAVPSGVVKLPAAWLIEHAGFHKGFVSGRVGISKKHSLALINRGGASAQEIIDLMELIQERVGNKFGIELQAEPVFVGFD